MDSRNDYFFGSPGLGDRHHGIYSRTRFLRPETIDASRLRTDQEAEIFLDDRKVASASARALVALHSRWHGGS